MREALLVLEDGSSFRGQGFGAVGSPSALFNTAMCGYQEAGAGSVAGEMR